MNKNSKGKKHRARSQSNFSNRKRKDHEVKKGLASRKTQKELKAKEGKNGKKAELVKVKNKKNATYTDKATKADSSMKNRANTKN